MSSSILIFNDNHSNDHNSVSCNNYIYMTYLSNDRDYKGVLLLNYCLQKYQHKYNLHCIILEGVSIKVKNILAKFNIFLHEYNLNNILNDFHITNDYKDYLLNKHYYGKFIIFKLIQYDKIIYLDSDLLIKENIDHLFRYDTTENKIYMTYDVLMNNKNIMVHKDKFNSGVIILKPSMEIYNTCYQSLYKYEIMKNKLSSDQTILEKLNNENQIRVMYLQFKYNYISLLTTTNIIEENPVIIHFILTPKPWQLLDLEDNVVNICRHSNAEKYFNEWIHLYFELIHKEFDKINQHKLYFTYDKIYTKINNEIIEEIPHLE